MFSSGSTWTNKAACMMAICALVSLTAVWRARMGTEAAKAIYKARGPTAEWANAQVRNRGLYAVRVRGQKKVLAVVLWYALVHNLWRWKALQAAAKASSGGGGEE